VNEMIAGHSRETSTPASYNRERPDERKQEKYHQKYAFHASAQANH
jgi:hypothetical protein